MFSGSKADYDSFKEDIDDWEFSTKIPKETRAARLILVQIEQVKKIMRTVPKEQRRTANGVSLIMKEMDKKYLQSPANTSNSKFETFNSMYRLKGETTESFILKYELEYDDLVKADPEVKCSEPGLVISSYTDLDTAREHRVCVCTRNHN